jgi:thiol-disulfide isomerase/thioredoxin
VASRRSFLTSTLLGLALALAACTPLQPKAAKPAALPSLAVRTLDSAETSLAATLHGRPALVSLWATWCDACKKEMPALDKVDAWAKDHDSLVVGVAVGEPLAKVSSFASGSRMNYLVLVDEEFRLADALGEKRVPATLVVDRNGRIVEVGGALDEHLLEVFRRLVDTTDAPRASR